MRIILAGGGTGGPVAPLLAVAEEIRKRAPETEFLFVGTKKGPECDLVEKAGLPFESIPAAKFRRYFSPKNFLDVFVFIAGFFKSVALIRKFRADAVFSVGGFVAVPLSWAARLYGCKILIHQQDSRAGLANKLISPVANKITTAFRDTTSKFSSDPGLFAGNSKSDRVEWTGNPVRGEFFDPDIKHREFFGLSGDLPVLLVFGGGTGADQLNRMLEDLLPGLVMSNQIIHITGPGKNTISFKHPNYHAYEFLTEEMPSAMKLADMVICRAGLSTISELSVLEKVAVIIPMPDSHQEENAQIMKDTHSAVIVEKSEFDSETVGRIINSLRFNIARQQMLKKNIGKLMPKDAAAKIAGIIIKMINNGE